jgi:hypothetical protein
MLNRKLSLLFVLLYSVSALATLGPDLETSRPVSEPTPKRTKILQPWSRLELIAQMSIFNPNSLGLAHAVGEAAHLGDLSSIPEFHLTLAVPMAAIENWRLFAQGRVGYFFKTGNLFESNGQGGNLATSLHLDSLPVSLSTRLEYQIGPAASIRPALTLGVGTQRFHASGPGFDEVAWIPFYFVTPSLSFLDGESLKVDWFGGFTFGVTYQSEFSSAQEVRGLSFDLSLNFIL